MAINITTPEGLVGDASALPGAEDSTNTTSTASSVASNANTVGGVNVAGTGASVVNDAGSFLNDRNATVTGAVADLTGNEAGTGLSGTNYTLDIDGNAITTATAGTTAATTTAADTSLASTTGATADLASTTAAEGTFANTAVAEDPTLASVTTADAATASDVTAKDAITADAQTTLDATNAANELLVAETAEVSDDALVNVDTFDMKGLSTGVNEDGSINEVGKALNTVYTQNISNVVDTTTVSGKLLAARLGEGNYLDAKATVAGQLSILSEAFVDPVTGGPTIPAFAAAATKGVQRMLAFKGVTGTAALSAVAAATMESILPIAQSEAKLFNTLTVKNLDARNNQALNTANILSNMNMADLDARMTAAVTNAKTFMTYDLANLDNRQQTAIVKAQARQQAILEDANQVNVMRRFNAESQNTTDRFYAELGSSIDQFNVSQRNIIAQSNADAANRASIVNAQEVNDANQFNVNQTNTMAQFNSEQANRISQFNAAEANAASQFNTNQTNTTSRFNASEANAASQFNTNQTNTTSRFNVSESNAASQFNAGELNDAERFNADAINNIAKFNAELESNREKFYLDMQYQVDASNAKWRRTVTLTNNDNAFNAAAIDVKNIVGLTSEQLNQLWDRADSLLDYAWREGESTKDRANKVEVAKLNYDAQMAMAAASRSAGKSSAVGSVLGSVAGGITASSGGWGAVGKTVLGIGKAALGFLGFSDFRLKTNIQYKGTLENGIDVFGWDWNKKAATLGMEGSVGMGVMAQQVKELMPHAVSLHESGYYQVNYGEVIK